MGSGCQLNFVRDGEVVHEGRRRTSIVVRRYGRPGDLAPVALLLLEVGEPLLRWHIKRGSDRRLPILSLRLTRNEVLTGRDRRGG